VSPFPQAARRALGDAQLRRNVGTATRTIRAKRAAVVDEVDDWEALREAGRALKARVMRHLDVWLERLEGAVTAAGGQVHWARDAAEANAVVGDLAAAHDAGEVVKVKSLTTDEIGLNAALAERGIEAIETDLAELIVQLSDDVPSHILVPAIHRNRAEIRELFLRALEEAVSGQLDVAARVRAREKSVLYRRAGVPRFAPIIHCDNQSSRRYTILDIITNNALGLLHRISRVISHRGCEVDLVLIGTEGEKAIDVFHITAHGAKLTDAEQNALTTDLTRMLEGNDEVDQGHRATQ
jgi:UTP:GlnB (protein PII) uridylyltransferase